MKMDHYCPFSANCIGYHNYKSFFLFCLFEAFTGIVFIAILVERGLDSDQAKSSLSYFGIFSLCLTVIIDLPFSIALIHLVRKHFDIVYSNVSTIEAR